MTDITGALKIIEDNLEGCIGLSDNMVRHKLIQALEELQAIGAMFGNNDEFDYRAKLLDDIWIIRNAYKNVFNETEQLCFDRMEKYVNHISKHYNK